ncbi:MAG: hypothetical protein N3B12_00440 [Armatimonadetes bacterium]|nr:hypothetical protein [Armatimonadota bacterium]
MRARAVIGVLVLFCLSVSSGSAREESTRIKLSDLVQSVNYGQIDWGNRMMYAMGEGAAPSPSEEPNRARAYLRAKEYAKMSAIANLLMLIEGTNITSEGTGKDYMADVTLRQTIEGYVKNVHILREERITSKEGMIARVWVGTPIFGDQTPGTAFLQNLAVVDRPKQPKLIEIPLDKPLPRPSVPIKQAELEEKARLLGIATSRPIDPITTTPPIRQEGPFTSLIVDARGFGVPQAMCPKIRKTNGDQIYGGVTSKTDPAVMEGLVSYARTLESARSLDRCGDNPMVVSAIGRGGGRSMCDVIVSDEAAARILRENSIAGFLNEYKVIFLVDPPGSGVSSALAMAP